MFWTNTAKDYIVFNLQLSDFRVVSSWCRKGRMGGVQPSKLAESSTVTGLSYLEDGQFAKIYKVRLDSSTVNGFSDLGGAQA